MSFLEKIENSIQGLLDQHGYEVVQVSFSGLKRAVLEITIERKDRIPISINDCETCSRMISILLDVDDPIDQQYLLQISSPGIDRPLVKLKDYTRFCGRMVVLKTHTALNGRKNFKGTIESVKDQVIRLALEKTGKRTPDSVDISFEDIRSAKLFIDFESLEGDA